VKVLYICHRIPYPPNKGDKIRAFHQLRAMSARHEVDLFTLSDRETNPAEEKALGEYCRRVTVARLHPTLARLRALPFLFTGLPLTVPYFYSRELATKIREAVRGGSYDRIFVYCSAMAQYVDWVDQIPIVTDLVDVDSNKWMQYAAATRFPFSAVYRREGNCLRRYERGIAERSSCVLVSTSREAELLRQISPAAAVEVVPNGVDTNFFQGSTAPRESAAPMVVFTGDMSYFPNEDAVRFFALEVLPLIRRSQPHARFLIVGREPGRKVRQLQKIDGVEVTGFVPDVRTYLAKAQVAVAPFSIAAGIQNKILEALAYGVPVVATARAVQGLSKGVAAAVETGTSAEELAARIVHLLGDPEMARRKGAEGRRAVEEEYNWKQALDGLLAVLENPSGRGTGQAHLPAGPVQAGPAPSDPSARQKTEIEDGLVQPAVLMLLTNAYDPDPRVRQEALGLSRMGCRVRLLAWDRDLKKPGRESMEGVEVERVFLASAHGRGTTQIFFYAWLYLKMLWRGWRSSFDVVHCHDLDTLPLGFVLGKMKRKPIVYDAHESFSDMLAGNVPRWVQRGLVRLENFCIRRIDLLITVGEKLRRHFADRGARRSVVVGNWKRLADFARSAEQNLEVRRRLGIPDRAMVVVNITQLLNDRKIEELLDAIDGFPDAYLIIGGKGILDERVRQRAEKNRRIVHVGFVPASEIPAYTCAADVVYYGFDPENPNARFSAPNKLFEALAAGRPLITGDFGEIADVVRQAGCGIVLAEYSAVEIRKALAALEDGDRLSAMAANAKRMGSAAMNWEKGEEILYREYSGLLQTALRWPVSDDGGARSGEATHDAACAQAGVR